MIFSTEMEMERPTGFNAGEYTFSVQSAMVEARGRWGLCGWRY